MATQAGPSGVWVAMTAASGVILTLGSMAPKRNARKVVVTWAPFTDDSVRMRPMLGAGCRVGRLADVIERFAPLRPDHIGSPLPHRMPRDPKVVEKILKTHGEAIDRGDPVYIDPLTKRSVMTAVFLASRGRCCSSGCRHCPYEA